MNKLEKRILKDLFQSSNGLYLFTFYNRYKIEPNKLALFIEKYREKKVIFLKKDQIYITRKGRKFLINAKLKVSKKSDKFANIPTEFKSNKLKINQPFLPDISDVSIEILSKEDK